MKTEGRVYLQFLNELFAKNIGPTRMEFVFCRPDYEDPTFFITFEAKSIPQLVRIPWSFEVEGLLLRRRAKMSDLDDEKMRFANILINNVRSAEDQYGRERAQGAFAATLKRLSGEGIEIGEVVSLLPRRTTASAYTTDECDHFLNHSVHGLINTITMELGYKSADEVSTILVRGALVHAADAIFKTSLRRAIGSFRGG